MNTLLQPLMEEVPKAENSTSDEVSPLETMNETNSVRPLLDEAVCDSLSTALNETNAFSFDEQLRENHSQACAVLDRLRHATAWINTHQETPKGVSAPTDLMAFMMFASLIKDSIEQLRKSLLLSDTIFDKGHMDSHRFFSETFRNAPLNIPEEKTPDDDTFFQYFRSLVFAHSGKVTKPNTILLPGEIQFCPYIIKEELSLGNQNDDDYVGVMLYSTKKERDCKVLRVRFSNLKAYLQSRYNSLRLVVDMVDQRIKEAKKTWRKARVDKSLHPLEQLKFMKSELEKRFEHGLCFEVQQLVSMLKPPVPWKRIVNELTCIDGKSSLRFRDLLIVLRIWITITL